MQIFNSLFDINLDFSLFYSYIASFSLNYFVLFADITETSIKQLLTYVGYSTEANPQNLFTNRIATDIFFNNTYIAFFSDYIYYPASDLSPRFMENLIAAANGENSFHNSIEFILSITNLSINYISIFFSIFFLVLVFFFFFMLFFTLFYPIPQQLFSSELFLLTIDSTYGLVEAEKEVGTLEDILLPLFLILSISVGWFFLLLPHQVINALSSYADSLVILFFCCIIISLPVNLLYECGFFFSTFFRGSAGSTSTLMELVYDLIANTTMFARMQVQHVRVLLGLAMYIETATFVETLSLNQLLDTPQLYNYINWTKTNEHFTNSGLSFVIDIIMQIATLIGELGHYILFLLQSSASYAALIFWLFSLLYSGFFKDLIEVYFVYKNLK